jgi:hypothetical protein
VNRWDWINRATSPEGPESTTVRYVLVVLVLHFFNEAERCAWPKVETLQERTGHKSIRTLQEALGEAEATGWLRREQRPGRVTRYFPTIPENRALMLTPAKSAGVTPQRTPSTPQKTAVDPAESADDLRKDSRKDPRKEEEPPAASSTFKCPACGGPMELKPKGRSRNGKPYEAFHGCLAYRSRGCLGKRDLDGADTTPGARLAEPAHGFASSEPAAGISEVVAADRARQQAHIARRLAELGLDKSPLARPEAS